MKLVECRFRHIGMADNDHHFKFTRLCSGSAEQLFEPDHLLGINSVIARLKDKIQRSDELESQRQRGGCRQHGQCDDESAAELLCDHGDDEQ
ncbi:hypothetical protein PGB34_16695 [Xenophilus arseniciresistens]|uniref:Uncharacterized protein n=1 Tax=Xenophilus arseniciresistens TaxID=1283306 RepID=A0AAE3NE85_9BURK|nr:hypothetical protein [Xenophilus arseniciresistens]MDA7418004.1 hypothetical protein [Xenophilus arseniciresistens]